MMVDFKKAGPSLGLSPFVMAFVMAIFHEEHDDQPEFLGTDGPSLFKPIDAIDSTGVAWIILDRRWRLRQFLSRIKAVEQWWSLLRKLV